MEDMYGKEVNNKLASTKFFFEVERMEVNNKLASTKFFFEVERMLFLANTQKGKLLRKPFASS